MLSCSLPNTCCETIFDSQDECPANMLIEYCYDKILCKRCTERLRYKQNGPKLPRTIWEHLLQCPLFLLWCFIIKDYFHDVTWFQKLLVQMSRISYLLKSIINIPDVRYLTEVCAMSATHLPSLTTQVVCGRNLGGRCSMTSQ